MIRYLPLYLASLLLPASMQAGTLSVGYLDGTRVTIETASTVPNAQASYTGAVISERTIWHRVVHNKQGKTIFAYDLDASRGAAPNTFRIRISPAAGPAPTVAAVRDFPEVKAGESVKIDILQNPATGEKIYDVLQPSYSLSAAAQLSGKAAEEEFRFGDLQIEIDGQIFQCADCGTLTGAAARIYVPGHGAYYFSLAPAPNFHEVAHVQHDKMGFNLDHEQVEIRSTHPLLTKSENRMAWVFHDPDYKTLTSHDNSIWVMTADDVAWIMPKKK